MLRASSLFRSYSSSSRFRRIWRDIYFYAWAGIRMYLGYSKHQIRQHIRDFWHLQTGMYSDIFFGKIGIRLEVEVILHDMEDSALLSFRLPSPRTA